MKFNFLKTLLLTLLLSLSYGVTADDLKSPRIAVLDWQGALMESNKVKEEFKNADQQMSAEQSRARQLAEEARSLQERLQRDSSIMSEDERRKISQQVEQKAQEYQFVASRLQKQLQEVRQEIVERHRPSLEAAVNEVIEEYKVDLLLDRQAVAFAKPQFDLTQAVADKLNKAK
ncbi:OmpH family outer membrane protein [Marinospirillum insulare]|uniref:Periplasmic chaperone for outer membrane proteins Skp n=1 Tax=Marinospirillum insulare TaxID=217169 RepID=A0ABQ5ZX70_9GAMM|nr:OmpH family outer membrane protein [Marinospirillum insulare]GLR63673.1 hypothetical protein GCM10007878_11080 [Marinospirillum insulare]